MSCKGSTLHATHAITASHPSPLDLPTSRVQEETAETGEEKFVTSAYKKQLQANKKWEEEQKRRDAWAERDDVTKKDGLADFYSNMLRGTNKVLPSLPAIWLRLEG